MEALSEPQTGGSTQSDKRDIFDGSTSKITETLAFAVSKGVRPRVEQRLMKDTNQVIMDMAAGKARMRFVLVNEDS
jgi:D-arabinose 1-dehydrogenase-like Zn-dependent alcohol dehydrogenase